MQAVREREREITDLSHSIAERRNRMRRVRVLVGIEKGRRKPQSKGRISYARRN